MAGPTHSQVAGAGRQPRRSVARSSSEGGSPLPREQLRSVLLVDPAPVTLVCAPAGAGKSTLLASLAADPSAAPDRGAEAAAPPAAHTVVVPLQDREDSAEGLWAAVLAALRGSGLLPDDDPLHELQAPTGDPGSGFLGDLTAAIERLDHPLRLILDDVHVLTDPAALQSLDELLLRPAHNLLLVLSTRHEPALALGRLRLTGRLRELRAAELALSEEEVAALLATDGVRISPQQVHRLHTRTEGWAAGVRIATLGLMDHPDPDRFLAAFDGTEEALAAYLAVEVFGRQPADTQEFLVRTSVCSPLPVALAALLSGRDDAGAVLAGLTRRQVLTASVAGAGDIYRYHPVLRTFLQRELAARDPEEVAALDAIAAAWYRATGDPLHALTHLRRAGDTTGIDELLRAEGFGLLLAGADQRFGRALDGLVEDQPQTDTIRLLRELVGLERRGVEPQDPAPSTAPAATTPTAAEPDRAPDDPWLHTVTEVTRLRRHILLGAADPAVDALAARLAEATGPADLRLYVDLQRGRWGLQMEAAEWAVPLMEQVARRARSAGHDGLAMAALSNLGVAELMAGQLHGARRFAEESLAIGGQRGWWREPRALAAHLVLAWLGYLQADRALAARHIEVAGAGAGPATDQRLLRSLQGCSVLIGLDAGEETATPLDRYLMTVSDGSLEEMSTAFHAHAGPLLVAAALRVGRPSTAAGLHARFCPPTTNPAEHRLQLAMLACAAGEVDRARELLTPLATGALPGRSHATRVIALLRSADLHLRRGAQLRAHDDLMTALALAEPTRLLRPFIDATERVQELLRRDMDRTGHLAGLAGEIVAGLRTPAGRDRTPLPLTPAEAGLLQELPSLLTIAEIATARGVSVNTVKTHLRTVYRKLEVNSRREAVEVARRRGLV